MKLYIKQKVFTWGDRFTVCDELQNVIYTVEGEVFTLGKKLHVKDAFGEEVAFIHQKLWRFMPLFTVEISGREPMEVEKEFSLFHPRYRIDGLGWTVEGNFAAHDFTISSAFSEVAVISRKWFTWGDTYEISVSSPDDELPALCTLLVIDAVMAQQSSSAGD